MHDDTAISLQNEKLWYRLLDKDNTTLYKTGTDDTGRYTDEDCWQSSVARWVCPVTTKRDLEIPPDLSYRFCRIIKFLNFVLLNRNKRVITYANISRLL